MSIQAWKETSEISQDSSNEEEEEEEEEEEGWGGLLIRGRVNLSLGQQGKL